MDSVGTSDVAAHNSHSNTEGKPNEVNSEKKKRVPKRVLHFSDGVLEEYSSDEDKENENKSGNNDEADCVRRTGNNQLLFGNSKNMYWSSWVWYQILFAGNSALKVCDYLGEKLAGFFGITSPKYEYEIDYYKTVKAEEEEQKKQEDLEMGGWNANKKQETSTSLPCSSIKQHDGITNVNVNERY